MSLDGLALLMSNNSKFQINTSDSIKCISSSEDGMKIAFGDNSGNITLANNEGNIIWEKNIDEGTYGIAIMKDGNRLVSGGKDCKLRMFNSLGNVEWEVNVGKSIWSLAVDPNGQVIVIGTGDSIAMFTESGSKLWEYDTRRAMVGVGVSRNGTNIVACGDEFLYCLNSEGNLSWKKQRSDALWDVDIERDSNSIIIGGWDCNVHSLDLQGNELWSFETKGYVRSVRPIENGKVLAGSHDHNIYQLNDKGEVITLFETNHEITCVSTSISAEIVYAGGGNSILGFDINQGSVPSRDEETIDTSKTHKEVEQQLTSENNEEYEPMFGFGMFDEPSPDMTEILEKEIDNGNNVISDSNNYSNTNGNYANTNESYKNTYQSSTPSYQSSSENIDKGGEYREFASKVAKGDVSNYLRLGNAAWAEKRLERAAEHFRKATEINPDEPRAWHNLAVCNYHLSLKRNPDDVESAVESAFEPLEIAKEKGGREYHSVNKTLAFLASQIGIEEEN
tara:strand:- start:515 stop:2032 length:1518 start_codon:yes stop_codon:yes gene_type:complete